MARTTALTRFEDVDLADPFFDSLEAGYVELPNLIAGKVGASLCVVADDASIRIHQIVVKRRDKPDRSLISGR